ncbi:MICAL-like protein 1 isoform X1 [Brachyistius frenatus]|uniref:MICAL-like protein 1 isoform X1 n=2 Tax=Brachyistius frenatus TaxID=100188 RepID=UPI0037E86B0A
MASPKALQEWCRVTCASYPSVEIKNMSTSFRDGLAFCAIIHKHRPDMIDFSSLSKNDVYQNNKLAFKVAETKLGIPALLDPKDMVSTKVPDCLSVITYLSQYYHFFNGKSCASPARLWSPHVLDTKSKASDGLTHLKSLTDVETSREDHFVKPRPRTVCHLCFRPVHLIQRRLVDGKVYHRSCFRCKVCRSTLLPESYTQGSDTSSLICTCHVADNKSTHVDLNQQIRSPDNWTQRTIQTGYYSLGGSAITSVPCYTPKPESRDRLVCETAAAEREERSREVKGRANTGSTVGPDSHRPDSKVQQSATKTSEFSSSCVPVTEASARPVPAPRRIVDPSVVPVPAPRTKMCQTMNSSPAAGGSSNQSKSPPSSSHITSPKVQTNHPWMTIVHPGPWTQLPPAPAPVPPPRSKSVSNLQCSSNRHRMPSPPNPFEEEEEEDEDLTKPSVTAVHAGKGGATYAVVCSSDAETPSVESEEIKVKPPDQSIPPPKPDFKEGGGVAVADPAKTTTAAANRAGASRQIGPSAVPEAAAGLNSSSDATQSHILPRSLSVPAITSDRSQTPTVPVTEAGEPFRSCQSKAACKENPFDREPAMTKSKTFQDLSSSRGLAPGHGFPLIKRKVRTDQFVSMEDLQVQVGELDKNLEALEQKGVELERNLRDCRNDKEEEQMLMEWFSLFHERHVLWRRDTELVYLTKQQNLEDRQADVEYDVRCLLNKPESDWSQEDRGREQQLMDELVAIIEQRNQIISSLDQERQREREEDMLWKDKVENKDLQTEGIKELKKSKGKFKPTKMFKMLNHRAQNIKDKKS